MSDSTRRSFLKASTVTRHRLALAGTTAAADPTPALNRRAFLQGSAGAAAGVAAVVTGPKLAAATFAGGTSTGPGRVVTKPSGPPPREPVTAYVRDAARGEVTVLSGTRETTYRDPVLVKHLLDAGR